MPKENVTAADLIEAALKTYRERGERYGPTYRQHGEVMRALFPKGIELKTVDDFNRFGILNMIVSKLTRMTMGDPLYEDNPHDMGVYSFMLQELLHNRPSTADAAAGKGKGEVKYHIMSEDAQP